MDNLSFAKVARNPEHLKYRPDIDGLRAVAVSSVICFHYFPHMMPGGFIGVDIFFVISGYLISTIVFSNLENNIFSIIGFYNRRIRRIFPALIVVMLVCIIFGWFVLLKDEYKQLGKHIIAASIFVQNFVLWQESGYFDNVAETKPLLHLWSLAIEEQFYIFWPLLLAFVWKRKWNFLYITAALAVASFALNIYFSLYDPVASFYSPFARFWELMVGGTLAYLQLHRPGIIKNYKNAQSVFGFACLALGMATIDRNRAFPGWWALLPTIGSFFIISAGKSAWLNRTVLSNRLFVWIGLISYPLYLWHWPLLSFAKIIRGTCGYKVAIVLAGLSIILSTTTYLYVERRFRKNGAQKKSPVLLLVSGMSLILILGILIDVTQIKPRLYNLNFAVSSKHEWGFLKSTKEVSDSNCTSIYPLHQERGEMSLFIGDSQLAQYAERIYHVQNQNANRNGAIFAVGGGCIPIPNVYTDDRSRESCWKNRNDAFKLAYDKRVSKVIIGGTWNWYFLDEGFYYLDKGTKESLLSKTGEEKALNALKDTILDLKKANKKVYLLLGNPKSKGNDPHFYIDRFDREGSQEPDRYVSLEERQKRLHLVLTNLANQLGVSVIDPIQTLCRDNRCKRISETGAPMYKDSSHFSPEWAVEHANFIDVTIDPAQGN